MGLPAVDQRQLPGQIEGVLHAGIHPLPSGRAVDVGRVAGQKDSAMAIVGDFAFADAETGQPDRVACFEVSRPTLVELGLHVSQSRIGDGNRLRRGPGRRSCDIGRA